MAKILVLAKSGFGKTTSWAGREKLGIKTESSGSGKYNKSNWFNSNGNTTVSDSSPKINQAEYDEVMNDISSIMD